jgi:hypothetical protein
MKKIIITEDKIKQTVSILEEWLSSDIVRATFVCQKIEKNNPDFIRGWRYGLYEAIKEIQQKLL